MFGQLELRSELPACLFELKARELQLTPSMPIFSSFQIIPFERPCIRVVASLPPR